MLAARSDTIPRDPRAWIAVGVSALLMFLSQPPVQLPGASLFAFVPWFMVLPRMRARGAFASGFAIASAYYFGNMWWLGQMVTEPGNEWMIFGMFALVMVIMAFHWGVGAMAMRWALTRRNPWVALLVPLIFVGVEFVREFKTPVPYPGLPIATTLVDLTVLVQTADFWGQYGIGVCIVLFNLGVAMMLPWWPKDFRPTRHVRFTTLGLALAFVVGSVIYGAVRMTQIDGLELPDVERPTIACVQGNLAQEVKVKRDPNRLPRSFQEHLDLSQQAADTGADLIVWPETMLFGAQTRDGLPARGERYARPDFPDGKPRSALMDKYTFTADGRRRRTGYVERLRAHTAYSFDTPVLTGTLTTIPADERDEDWKDYSGRYYNTAMMFDRNGRTVATYDKRVLVPGGEYVPLEGNPIVRAIVEGYAEGLQGYASHVEFGRHGTVFPLTGRDGRQWHYSVSICYEFVWPMVYADYDAPQDFHVLISNEGWFRDSAEMDQGVNFCRLRAIESRTPMVRATNNGISCSIDANGRVTDRLLVDGRDRDVQGVFYAKPAVLSERPTSLFHTLFGRFFGFLGLAVYLVTLGAMFTRRFILRKPKPPAEDSDTKRPEPDSDNKESPTS